LEAALSWLRAGNLDRWVRWGLVASVFLGSSFNLSTSAWADHIQDVVVEIREPDRYSFTIYNPNAFTVWVRCRYETRKAGRLVSPRLTIEAGELYPYRGGGSGRGRVEDARCEIKKPTEDS
jgi:hypothetical protein